MGDERSQDMNLPSQCSCFLSKLCPGVVGKVREVIGRFLFEFHQEPWKFLETNALIRLYDVFCILMAALPPVIRCLSLRIRIASNENARINRPSYKSKTELSATNT